MFMCEERRTWQQAGNKRQTGNNLSCHLSAVERQQKRVHFHSPTSASMAKFPTFFVLVIALSSIITPRRVTATPGTAPGTGTPPAAARPRIDCGDLNAREVWTAGCLALHGLAMDKERRGLPGYINTLAVGRGEDEVGLTQSLRIRDPRDGKVL